MCYYISHGLSKCCQCRRCKRCGLDFWIRKIPWSRKWQPAPVFLGNSVFWEILEMSSILGNSMGRGACGLQPWGHTELGMTERTHITCHMLVT